MSDYGFNYTFSNPLLSTFIIQIISDRVFCIPFGLA